MNNKYKELYNAVEEFLNFEWFWDDALDAVNSEYTDDPLIYRCNYCESTKYEEEIPENAYMDWYIDNLIHEDNCVLGNLLKAFENIKNDNITKL